MPMNKASYYSRLIEMRIAEALADIIDVMGPINKGYRPRF
jgi:hypothetical protein